MLLLAMRMVTVSLAVLNSCQCQEQEKEKEQKGRNFLTDQLCSLGLTDCSPVQSAQTDHDRGYDQHSPQVSQPASVHHHVHHPQPVYQPQDDSYSSASSEYASPSYAFSSSGQQGANNSPYEALNKVGDPASFQNTFSDQGSLENIRPTRADGQAECYCVAQSQCPSHRIVGHTEKDYSSLINPRNKDLNAGITSAGRNIESATEDKEDVESEEILDSILKTDVFGRARSLNSLIEAMTRRRRRSPDGNLHQHLNSQFDPNIHLSQQGNQQFPDERSIAERERFGPSGYRPPTCGGAGSGFVCCSVYDLPSEAGQGPDIVRDVRAPQQGNHVAASQGSRTGQCGRRNAHGVTGRINNPAQIVDEGDTEFGEYPWQAALLKKEEYDNVYVCGGSLIDSSHILTAAHCVKHLQPGEIRARLGEWDVNNDGEFFPNIEFDVVSISIHPEFYSGNLYNDIAIIKLSGFVNFPRNPHISPVCLPDTFQDFAGQRCYVSGWGKDTFGGGGSYQQVLKEVDVPVLLDFNCERKLKRTRLGLDFVLHPSFVCAGGEEGKDSCKGDGGGPLVCQVGDSWQLAGIVSWGVGCGEKDIPGVYVKVSHFNQWIRENTITT